jgi:hypothetical protein
MRENQLMDDRRLQLDEGNMFRFYKQNGMPKMPVNSVPVPVVFRTAWEIQQERLASKRTSAE